MSIVEEVLGGGNMTAGIVRVGDTVRRPRGRRSSFSMEVLQHLNAAGYAWAPRYLGVDDQDRDVLAFVPGETTGHPLQRDEGCYRMVGKMLRELHDATRGSALGVNDGCIVHGDPGPYNVVSMNGLPVALIDWDTARPGDPLEDVGYAGWTWCVQSLGGSPVGDQARRLRQLVDGYDGSLGADVVLEAVERQQTGVLDAETRALADPSSTAQRQEHAKAAINWAQSDRKYFWAHAAEFRAALRA